MQKQSSYGDLEEDTKGGSLPFTFNDIANGTYAMSVWRDINENGIFDTDSRGMPLDGWAMSNGSTLRGRPIFTNVSIGITGAYIEIIEALQY